jgi:SAM-dependent methyltransferase
LFILFRSHQSNFVLFPPKLEGCTVVDLGCGVGRDVFILSKLVGENGKIIGIDSEKDQVNIILYFRREMHSFRLKRTQIRGRSAVPQPPHWIKHVLNLIYLSTLSSVYPSSINLNI